MPLPNVPPPETVPPLEGDADTVMVKLPEVCEKFATRVRLAVKVNV